MSYFSFVLNFFYFFSFDFSIHPPRKSLSSSVASSSFDYIIYSRESRAHILLGHTNGSFFMARSQRKRSFVRSTIREKTKQQKEVQTTNEGCVRKRRSSNSKKDGSAVARRRVNEVLELLYCLCIGAADESGRIGFCVDWYGKQSGLQNFRPFLVYSELSPLLAPPCKYNNITPSSGTKSSSSLLTDDNNNTHKGQ